MEKVPTVSPELPSASWRLILRLLGRLPQRGMSRSFGAIADVHLPRRLRSTVLGTFARAVGADLSEMELPLADYASLNAFFVRRLRAGLRRWPDDPRVIASPVDGIVGASGHVAAGRAIQAKGHDYSVGELLGDPASAARFEGGAFVTIYLSPRHYHRIHTPVAGTIREASYVPGALMPVNAPAVMHIPGLFAKNERMVCNIDTDRGRVAVVAVGAYNVGRISAAFDPAWGGSDGKPWTTNQQMPATLNRTYDSPVPVGTGDEIMAFHLGSTIVLLAEPAMGLEPARTPGTEVRLGDPLGR